MPLVRTYNTARTRNASPSGWMQPNSSASRVKCVELAEDLQVTDRSAREADFDAFFRDTRSSLVGQAYLLVGDLATAHDLVQEALARCWTHWQTVGGYESPAGWTRLVLHRLAHDHLKHRRRSYSTGFAVQDSEPPSADHLAVLTALQSLRPEQRRALVLRGLVGLSVAEVASEMGVPAGTVKSWLSRGRERVAKELGIDPTTLEIRGELSEQQIDPINTALVDVATWAGQVSWGVTPEQIRASTAHSSATDGGSPASPLQVGADWTEPGDEKRPNFKWHWVSRPVIVAVAALIVVGVIVGTEASNIGSKAPQQVGPAAKSTAPSFKLLMQAVNEEGQSWHLTAAPSGAHVAISRQQAAASAAAGGSRLERVGLVRWTDDYPSHSTYVWAVFTDPPDTHVVLGGPLVLPGSPTYPPSQFNLVVTFVDGTTGVVLASNDAYNAHLPALTMFGS